MYLKTAFKLYRQLLLCSTHALFIIFQIVLVLTFFCSCVKLKLYLYLLYLLFKDLFSTLPIYNTSPLSVFQFQQQHVYMYRPASACA